MGRYLDALRQLHEPEVQATAWSAAVRELYEEFATMEAAESWRHRRYLKAVDDGEPHPGRWSLLVPVACAIGDHRWHQWGGPDSSRTCLDCRGRLEDDGVVRWPPDLVGALWGGAVRDPAADPPTEPDKCEFRHRTFRVTCGRLA